MGIKHIDNKNHELLSFIQFLAGHKHNSLAALTSVEITPGFFYFRYLLNFKDK